MSSQPPAAKAAKIQPVSASIYKSTNANQTEPKQMILLITLCLTIFAVIEITSQYYFPHFIKVISKRSYTRVRGPLYNYLSWIYSKTLIKLPGSFDPSNRAQLVKKLSQRIINYQHSNLLQRFMLLKENQQYTTLTFQQLTTQIRQLLSANQFLYWLYLQVSSVSSILIKLLKANADQKTQNQSPFNAQSWSSASLSYGDTPPTQKVYLANPTFPNCFTIILSNKLRAKSLVNSLPACCSPRQNLILIAKLRLILLAFLSRANNSVKI